MEVEVFWFLPISTTRSWERDEVLIGAINGGARDNGKLWVVGIRGEYFFQMGWVARFAGM